jgi:hypothetical protein
LPTRSRPVFIALGLLPFAWVWAGSRVLVPRMGDCLGHALARIATPSPEGRELSSTALSPTTQPTVVGPSPALDASAAPEPIAHEHNAHAPPSRVPSGPPKQPATSARAGSSKGPPDGRSAGGPRLIIAADRVAALTADQLRSVRWMTVTKTQGGLAGVRLFGVSGLGLGLTDGDVVTSINGRQTPADEVAVSAGVSAWTSGAPSVEATIARGNQPLSVTLHLPPR